jgi:5-formyltetrahydrofolate cyclo-ligase
MGLGLDKQAIRERVWRKLESEGVATFPKPVRGRIPNFIGSREAAIRLRSLSEYVSAKSIFVNPDSPQLPVREMVLEDGKRLIMASPKLREGFIEVIPASTNPKAAASIRGAMKFGKRVQLRSLRVDFVVEGSVAVDQRGGRLGKAGGFGDLEFAILKEIGAISDSTPIATTVHELQIVDRVPMEKHDAPVDFIMTPSRMLKAENRYPKPPGIFWELLPIEAFEQMPLLREVKLFVTT